MRFPFRLCRRAVAMLLAAGMIVGGTCRSRAQLSPEDELARRDAAAQYEKEANEHLQTVSYLWRHARLGEEKRHYADELYDAAIRADRPDVAEEAVAGGTLKTRQVSVPRHGRTVPLRLVHRFDEIDADSRDEFADTPNEGNDGKWLARRITPNALEVWTPTHGWLFDGQGNKLHEARSPGDEPMGRGWYGAFLPDGRWATTELGKSDCTLTIFSREGKRLRDLPNAGLPFTDVEGVPPDAGYLSHSLLGWARGNKDGTAWIVNVGSEQGFATVQVSPEGSTRQLFGIKRWQVCYPRALGPRGWYIDMWVPDDAGSILLTREEAGHGPNVGYPSYSITMPQHVAMPDGDAGGKVLFGVPDGDDIFGFWPGRKDLFAGAIRGIDAKSERIGQFYRGLPTEENATWFFDPAGHFRGWLRGRRLADAADGRAMLFRMEGSHQVVTLRPDLRTARARRFTWADGRTAVALSLFDDLRLGLFIKDGKLALAGWDGPKS